MASYPPDSCCTRGHLFEGEPKGKHVKLEDGKTDAYIASPPSSGSKEGAGILYIPDVFGIWQNSMLLADAFAASGYTTLVVDIFSGDALKVPLPDDFDLMTWIEQGTDGSSPHTPDFIDPIIVSGIKTMRAEGIKMIGAAGYCFGAKYVVRHYKNGIAVGYTAHPSFVDDEELAAITGPLAISAAEIDSIFPPDKRHQSEVILSRTGQPYQITLFQGVEHGFATKGDPSVKVARFAKEQAFAQAVAWFDEFLVKI